MAGKLGAHSMIASFRVMEDIAKRVVNAAQTDPEAMIAQLLGRSHSDAVVRRRGSCVAPLRDYPFARPIGSRYLKRTGPAGSATVGGRATLLDVYCG